MIVEDNRVKNVVTFFGTEAAVRQIRKQLWKGCEGGRDMVFNPQYLCPIPEGMTGEESEQFCRKNWGCSGFICQDEELSPNCISFVTDGAPPRKVFERLSALYPDIPVLVEYARYDGKGIDFAGQILYKEGRQGKESFVTSTFVDLLLNEVKGKPFSIKDSQVFRNREQDNNKDNSTARRLLSQMKTKELNRLKVVMASTKLLTDDMGIVSGSAVVRQVEKNYSVLERLDGLAGGHGRDTGKDVPGMAKDVLQSNEKDASVWRDKDATEKGRGNNVKRSVLTRPRYRRSKPLPRENGREG